MEQLAQVTAPVWTENTVGSAPQFTHAVSDGTQPERESERSKYESKI